MSPTRAPILFGSNTYQSWTIATCWNGVDSRNNAIGWKGKSAMKWPLCSTNGVGDCVWPSDRGARCDWLARQNCITDKIYNWCNLIKRWQTNLHLITVCLSSAWLVQRARYQSNCMQRRFYQSIYVQVQSGHLRSELQEPWCPCTLILRTRLPRTTTWSRQCTEIKAMNFTEPVRPLILRFISPCTVPHTDSIKQGRIAFILLFRVLNMCLIRDTRWSSRRTRT